MDRESFQHSVLFSDRIILIRLNIGQGDYTFISVYAPQSGLTEADKWSFNDMHRVHTGKFE